MADLNKVDPLTTASEIGKADGKSVTPSSFLLRQWQLIRQFVNATGTNLSGLIAAIARIDATRVDGVGALGGGGAIGDGDISISHDDSAVTPGTYGDATNVPQFTVDAKGHVTAVTDVPIVAGTAAWSLIASHDFGATPQANFSANNLNYQDILVIFRGLADATTGTRQVVVSTDNGATYRNTVGDYADISGTGVESAGSAAFIITSNTTLARSGTLLISAANLNGVPKYAINSGTLSTMLFIQSFSPIDAIRIQNSAGGNLTGGIVYFLGR